MGVTAKGAPELAAKMASLKQKLPGAAAAALYQKAAQIMTASDSIVPVKYGRLRASHYVTPPTMGDKPSITMGYGASYALPVHENLAAHHEHGQAKFLELAWHEHTSRLGEWMALKIKENLERGISMVTPTLPTTPSEGK